MNIDKWDSQGNLSLYLFLFIMLAFLAKLMSAVHGTWDSSCKSYIATQWTDIILYYDIIFIFTLQSQVRLKYILHLKLLLKAWAVCLWVLFLHVCDDCPKFMSNHSSVSTAKVVIEGIMDEGILVLWKDYENTDDRTLLYSQVVMVMPRKIFTGIYTWHWENL